MIAGTLADIAKKAKKEEIEPPAILVVGEVVRLAGLLAHRKIAILRPAAQQVHIPQPEDGHREVDHRDDQPSLQVRPGSELLEVGKQKRLLRPGAEEDEEERARQYQHLGTRGQAGRFG